MYSMMGIILTGGKNNRLKELSAGRSISAVPFGGKYRAIDFALSNMINSGIRNVGIPTQYNFHSLIDHLGSGKEWDLDRKNDGLFILPPCLSEYGTGWYRGNADAMYSNLTFLNRSNEEFVLINQGYAIYNMNYTDMLKHHVDKDADITIACRHMTDFPKEYLCALGIVETDTDMRITDMQEKPLNPKSDFASMGVYIIKRKLLISLLEESAAHGYYEFVRDIIIKKVNELRLYAYEFKGYWRPLCNIQLYYMANMELLNPEIRYELFEKNGKIFTKVKDEPPAKYNDEAVVKNSIVADGCIIEGHVENSILFRGVKIKRGAVIKDSIIMQDSVVCENALLDCCILDKSVIITAGKQLKGDKNWPLIVGKNVVV
ncbi:glucose-1-phosphate adenylyltransferase GlgD [Thermoclostridium stercorarium subsp. stercorarium DSM 8532]|uniref:Glucose-1-phosphate adenylyltransferase GlgD n=1 Tax=Thermoclostridium stercorarium (strain ATCC 35414 / DSM 8532 / NCIMB 11754) TaxID=1121335 RepID=L7VQE4_THES1|nr:glucose-1-phosphate adenylyltransferase subunit GlgD [Thermoclostridium stercorarium]AGC69027.1 glucose-1-phosphate adenylyltransferase GlgD [Thermoclostridium stercorarium subsp. stercorarium DSM 8532]UZQ84991.1 glucose-1-phosphate adenylyltransferase subunit GlgD [Thermoclostridium stercorarium]